MTCYPASCILLLHDSAKYDLVAQPALSIPQLRICNQAMTVSRLDKTRAIADSEAA